MNTNYRIEPLRRGNYDTWKVQAKAILIKNGTWGYVDDTIRRHTGGREIDDCRTAKEVWETSENIYSRSCPARKVSLLNNHITAKLKEIGDIRDHFEKKNGIEEYHLINLPTLYVPSITTNLLSVAKITDNIFAVLFKKNKATLAERRDGLYYMNPMTD